MKGHAREIRHAKRLAKSGIVTKNTMVTFRSRSARIIWLVQMSSEMWEYASPYRGNKNRYTSLSCDLYFDKFVAFMHKLFQKWKKLEVTHSLTIVFFSRTLLTPNHAKEQEGKEHDEDVYGRAYEVCMKGRSAESRSLKSYPCLCCCRTTIAWCSRMEEQATGIQ